MFLRDVWIRTQSAAVASWRTTDLATRPSNLATHPSNLATHPSSISHPSLLLSHPSLYLVLFLPSSVYIRDMLVITCGRCRSDCPTFQNQFDLLFELADTIVHLRVRFLYQAIVFTLFEELILQSANPFLGFVSLHQHQKIISGLFLSLH
jgi:hypothetical protein